MKELIINSAKDIGIGSDKSNWFIMPRLLRYFFLPAPPQIKVVLLYRLSNFFWGKGHRLLSAFFSKKLSIRYSCYISGTARIGGGLKLPHPVGVVIGEGTVIGEDVTIYQNVTIGRKHSNLAKYPSIGSKSVIYTGAVIIGDISVGEGTVIGANSVVATDTEPFSIYCGAPAIRKGYYKESST